MSNFLEALGIGLQRGGQAGFGAAQLQNQQRRQNLSDMIGILTQQRLATGQRQTQEFRQGQAKRAEESLDLARRAQVFRQFESDISGAQEALKPGKQLTKTQIEGQALQEMFSTDPQFKQDYLKAMLGRLTKSGQLTEKRDVTTTIPLGQARGQALKDFETKREEVLSNYAAQAGLDIKDYGKANVEADLRLETDPQRTIEAPWYKFGFGEGDRVEPNPLNTLLQQLQYYSPSNIRAVDSATAAIQGTGSRGGFNPSDTLPAVQGGLQGLSDEELLRIINE